MANASTSINIGCPPSQLAQPIETLQLGQLLLARGDISAEQLSLALDGQKCSGRKLGEELISAGFVKGLQIDFVLRIQQRLATVAQLSDLL